MKDERTVGKDTKASLEAKLAKAELKAERFELLSTRREVEHLNTEKLALKDRLEKMKLEATMIQQRLTEIDELGVQKAEDYNSGYADLKKKMQVPDGCELDLTTGESSTPKAS